MGAIDKAVKTQEFFATVCKNLGIVGWLLECRPNGSDGYCWIGQRKITLGLQGNWRRLLLHEVAHIGTCEGSNNKHSIEWRNKFESLCLKYGEEAEGDGAFSFNNKALT